MARSSGRRAAPPARSNARLARAPLAGLQAGSASRSALSDRARIRLAEDHRPSDAGRRCSGRRSAGSHRFSLATARRGGDRASRAEADRCSSGSRRERAYHPTLAVAGPRRAGCRRRSFLFLVDPEPDPTCSACRQCARASDVPAGDRRTSAAPSSRARANGASSADSTATPLAQPPAPPAPPPAPSTDAQATPPPPPAPAPSTDAQATAPQPAPPPPPAAPTAPAATTEQAPATSGSRGRDG